MCVQDVDVQCVLQFTLIHAAGCALHRRTSRVIHRIELYPCTIERRRCRPRNRDGGPRPVAVPGRSGTSRSRVAVPARVGPVPPRPECFSEREIGATAVESLATSRSLNLAWTPPGVPSPAPRALGAGAHAPAHGLAPRRPASRDLRELSRYPTVRALDRRISCPGFRFAPAPGSPRADRLCSGHVWCAGPSLPQTGSAAFEGPAARQPGAGPQTPAAAQTAAGSSGGFASHLAPMRRYFQRPLFRVVFG